MNAIDPRAAEITRFWREAGPEAWFKKDAGFDAGFRQRFEALHFEAAARKLDGWAETDEGALALFILLDQLPRNSYRGTGHMFATDPLALHFARVAVERGLDKQVEAELRPFFYLPFMHSEDLADQLRCVELCRQLPGDTIKYAEEHADIIRNFGRFPHRNEALGRQTTPQEQAYLDGGGFAG